MASTCPPDPASPGLSSSHPRISISRARWRLPLLFLFCAFLGVEAGKAGSIARADATPTLKIDIDVPDLGRGGPTGAANRVNELRLAKRKDSDKASTATISITIATKAAQSASPLPSPFDSSLASDFLDMETCPQFINSFMEDATFKSCYPFSLLLQGSSSFFEAEKSLSGITHVLDATCAANVTMCSDYFDGLAANLTDASNCGTDYENQTPMVMQAYLGMRAYQTVYKATCLKDPDESTYCFADAITNLTNPSNVYLYYLPLNMTMPDAAEPSCSRCAQNTMAIFNTAAADRSRPIADTYVEAAKLINTVCGADGTDGADFVSETLPEPVSGAGPSRSTQASWWLLATMACTAAVQCLL